MSTSVEERERRLPAAGVPFPDHLLIPTPAAGASVTFKLDAEWEWNLQSLTFTLATSAVVANRMPFIRYADPDGTFWYSMHAGSASVAGAAGDLYTCVAGLGTSASAAPAGTVKAFELTLPDVWLPRGWQLQVTVAGMDAGDQLSALRLYTYKRLAV